MTATGFSFREIARLVILASVLLTGVAQAGSSTIRCDNIDNKDTCFVENSSVGFGELVADVISSVDGASGDCVQVGTNAYECNLASAVNEAGQPTTPPQKLLCTSNGSTQASCVLKSATNSTFDNSYFGLSCSVATKNGVTSGQCTLSSNEEAIAADLAQNTQLSTNQVELGANLLAGCALQGGVIDGEQTAFQRDCNALSNLIANDEWQKAESVIAEITPRNPDLAADTSSASLNTQRDGVSNRMSRLRNGTAGGAFDTAGVRLFDGMQWVSGGMQLAAGEVVMTDAVAPVAFADSRLGVFIDATLITGEQQADDIEGALDQDGQTFTLGIDYRISDQWIAGVAYSVSMTDAEFGGDNSMETQGFNLLGYGTWYHDAWYAEGTLAAGSDRYDQVRRLACSAAACGTSFDLNAEANYYGLQTAATVGGGYQIALGALTLTPNVQYALTRVDTDDYIETTRDANAVGAGYLLDMDETSRDLSTVTAGISTQYAISTSFGVLLPQLSAELVRELDDDAMLINGQFVGDVANDEAFSLISRSIDTTYGLLGAGISAQFTGGSSGYVTVNSLAGYTDMEQTRLSAGWRWEI